MTPTTKNIYLTYKKKFEETGDLTCKEVMDKYKLLLDAEPVEVVEVVKVKSFIEGKDS